MYQLTVQSSEAEGVAYLITRNLVKIGQSPECDIVVPNPSLAGKHAVFHWHEQVGFQVEAMPGATVSVNGISTTGSPLVDGDVLRLGNVQVNVAQVEDTDVEQWKANVTSPVHSLETVVTEQHSELERLRPLVLQVNQLQEQLNALKVSHTKIQQENQQSQDDLLHQLEQTGQQRDQALHENSALHAHIQDLDQRLLETEMEAKQRVQRIQASSDSLRALLAQRENELRDQRNQLLKMQQTKNAAETQLEQLKRAYTRDLRQHGRLVDQFRERARREMLRADQAQNELKRKAEAAAAQDPGRQTYVQAAVGPPAKSKSQPTPQVAAPPADSP